MIVIHDDLDLAFGRVRIKVGGGDGGHKGIRSIADSLRFRDFVRVRVGIGRPPEGITPEAFVLSPFLEEERSQLPDIIARAGSAIKQILEEGVDKAQNIVHSRRAGSR
jgi:PTH1 family peptidyl-tRNA hydrolase